MLIPLLIIFVISLVLAARSMHDFGIPKEIEKFLAARKIRGTILFFNDDTKHYHA